MKYYFLILSFLWPLCLYGQQQKIGSQEGMSVAVKNYRFFSKPNKHVDEEVRTLNKEFTDHPELGMLYAEAPVSDCIEVIGERTETSKKFIRSGSNGREVMLQTSTDAMHYRDAAGIWRTIQSKLKAAGKGIYTAGEQPVPVTVNVEDGFTSIGKGIETFLFNRNLELVYRKQNGKEVNLGAGNWTDYTAGDDGAFFLDIWPGIDMEVAVHRGAVKTNFYIKHALPGYSGGSLLLRDHLQAGAGIQLPEVPEENYKGNLIVKSKAGKTVFTVSAATAYEQNNVSESFQLIGYKLSGNELDIVIPGDFLNRAPDAYPVVIDPLISSVTVSTVGGSSYSPSKTIGCDYFNIATVPPNVTVTDVRWTFNYVAGGGALLSNGAVDFRPVGGTCRSPAAAGFFWYCNLSSAGTCTGSNVSIFSDLALCIPAPQCAPYPLNLNMRFYQNYASTTPCANTYITSGTPLTITVFGRTIETSAISSVGGLTSICLGQSVHLSSAASFGVPPYTYMWNPGTTPGNPVVLTPAATTPYTVTATDACGQTATAAQTILVSPITPITGSNIVCIGGTTTLINLTGGGTWSSTDGAVAVVGPSSGIVSGITPGTTIISYITPLGCYATKVITVTPLPGAISGTPALCVGASSALTNSMVGGTWSSSALGVAVVGAGTGLVTGVSPGTSTISYVTSPGCISTITVTVYANPSVSGVSFTNPTTCGATDGSITLTGLTAGVTYTVDFNAGASPVSLTLTANGAGQIIISGLAAGVYSAITVTAPTLCTGGWHSDIILVDMGTPPVPLASNNSPVCEGGTLTLNAVSAPGVTYTWAGPGGFSSTLQSPVINPASAATAGEYSVTATLLGCITLPGTTTVTVNPLPHIWGMQSTNPVTCGGSEGSITLEGLNPGVTYNIGFMLDGTPDFISEIADGLGNVVVYSRSSGTYENIFVTSLSCVSNLVGPVTLTDPPAPPSPVISSNAPVCVGQPLLLYGTNDKPGGSYSWMGPDGFTSNMQNPAIPITTIGSEGVYTLSYTRFNCTSITVSEIKLQPVVKLTDVWAATYQLPFGDSVQLHASGATYYNWTPHNGTLSDHFIYNPVAKPRDSITVYTVHGMNEWACHDSANITLRVIFDEDEYIPTAFTPNGDGKNDIFRVGKMRFKKMIDFTIYNRWGQEVYHNPFDNFGGWDGTAFGRPAEMGVYYYSITVETASGKLKYYKGDVTLLR